MLFHFITIIFLNFEYRTFIAKSFSSQDALQPEASDEHGLLFESEPYAMWEYNSEMLSDTIDCGYFDFNKSVDDDENSRVFEGALEFNRYVVMSLLNKSSHYNVITWIYVSYRKVFYRDN